MPGWFLFFLLLAFLALGVGIGVLIQRRRLPGRIRRRVITKLASFRRQAFRAQDGYVTLKVRAFQQANNGKSLSTEKDGHYAFHTLEIPASELALILIDVWADHPIKGWIERAEQITRTKLVLLVEAARERGVLVVHCPHGEPTHPLVNPMPTELVLDGPGAKAQLIKVLQQRGTKYLLYAGYASNMCVLTRPTGIIEMAQDGYRIVFVRDASLAIEAPDLLDEQTTHKVATYMVETNWGTTTNVEDIVAALESR